VGRSGGGGGKGSKVRGHTGGEIVGAKRQGKWVGSRGKKRSEKKKEKHHSRKLQLSKGVGGGAEGKGLGIGFSAETAP